MENAKRLSIQLKLEKAKSLLAEIDVLTEHEFYSTAINRIYYACFHSTKALLLTKDIIPKTHNGVVAMLHKYFVLEGLFDIEKASFFSRLMQERVDDDYSDLAIISKALVEEFFILSKDYVDYIQKLIAQNANELS
jgi:uncharacterized protein (UPF0332 family)